MLTRSITSAALLLITLALLGQGDHPVAASAAARFGWVDVVVSTGDLPLAAYQVEVRPAADAPGRESVRIVGIEGGDAGPFASPPFYDPEAMKGERVIIAAVSTKPAAELPRGKVRVARVHIRWEGDPRPSMTATLSAAGDADGRPLQATSELIEHRAADPADRPAHSGDGQ